MKTITFCRDGEAITDFDSAERVNDFIISNRTEWKVGNSLILDYFRVKIHTKEIELDDYEFFVEDLKGEIHYFNVDKNGRSSDWTDSTHIWQNLITKLL